MLTRPQYIEKSLEQNLFWARIMREHSIFLEAGFVCKDSNLARQADAFKSAFTMLLAQATRLANGVIPTEAMAAQEFVTNNTLPAEQKTMSLSGIPIDTTITQAEIALTGDSADLSSPQLATTISNLNQKAMVLSAQLAEFKRQVLTAVLACNLFTWNFPLLIEHIRREALFYNMSLNRLQRGMDPHDPALAGQLEAFWNRIMAEHSLFIRQLVDPTEENLFATANNFASTFKALTAEAEAADSNPAAVADVTAHSLPATRSLRDFKKQGTELILACQVKSLIVPLLGDHVTREANHYLRMLKHLQDQPG